MAFVAAALLAGGCTNEEKSAPAAEPAKTEAPAAGEKAETPEKAGTLKKAEPLTQEELDLIDADPATLTPELRRKRAFALRKRIMQNPDSPQAQALEEMRLKVKSGEITPQLPPKQMHLEAPGVPAGHPPSSIPDDDAKAPAH